MTAIACNKMNQNFGKFPWMVRRWSTHCLLKRVATFGPSYKPTLFVVYFINLKSILSFLQWILAGMREP